MTNKVLVYAAGLVMLLLIAACGKQSSQITTLKKFPVDNLDSLITLSNVEIDKAISSDGNGSLKITALESTTVRVYEINDVLIDNAQLVYQARLRCDSLNGRAYLEMLCHFPGMGDYFSRGLQSPVTGTSNWISVETPFFLRKGERPDIIKLNLVVAGKGTVWIDDISLLKAPLK